MSVEQAHKKSAFDLLTPNERERLKITFGKKQEQDDGLSEKQIRDILQPKSEEFETATVKKFLNILAEKDIKEALRQKKQAVSQTQPTLAPQDHQPTLEKSPEKKGIFKTLEKIIFQRGKKISKA
jgi:ribosomal protein L12E/L44/L45/RPP1/RPP2